jgi:hypothetical protein
MKSRKEKESMSRRGKRLYLWISVAIGVVVVSVGALVYASVPHTFVPNEPLTAANLNSNFAGLDTRVGTLETNAAAMPTITRWAAYTPTVSSGGGAAIATQTSTGFWRRVGDTVEISIDTMFTACSAAGSLRWSLPAGVVPDATKLAFVNMLVGTGLTYGPAGIRGLYAIAQGASPFIIPDLTTGGGGGITCNDIGIGGVDTRLTFSLPVQGW